MRKNLAVKEEHILAKKPLVNNAQIKTIVMGVKTAELKLNWCTHWSFLTVPYFNGFFQSMFKGHIQLDNATSCFSG